MRKHLRRCLALALLPVLLLSGCWSPEEDEQGSGSLLPTEEQEEQEEAHVSLPEAFVLPCLSNTTFDPITCPDGAQQVVGSLVYEGLFELDEHFEPQARLCESYTYDPVALTYTLTLRSGVTFSDGSPLTAQDVAATLQRAKLSDRYRARLNELTSASAAGPQTVLLTLNHANSGFTALLDLPIVKAGTETSLTPLGTGPYAFSNQRLTPNSHWWQAKELPIQEIHLSPAMDRDGILYQFTSHEVQLLTADLTSPNPVSVTGRVQFSDADTTILHYLGFNTRRSLFQKEELRAALNLGINRESVVSAYFSGHGIPAQFPLSPLSDLYPSDLEQPYSYDGFSKAMKEAGFQRGRTVRATLIVNAENPFKVSAATHLASSLSNFDLKIEVKALPWDEYLSALHSGRYDLYFGEVKLSADWNLIPLLSSSGSLNYGGWSDPALDQLLAAYAQASDRKAAMEALCGYLKEHHPILPLAFKSTSVLTQEGVLEGLNPSMSSPFYDLSSCQIHLKESREPEKKSK